MQHWPWWLGGILLAILAVVHWLLLGRLMAVSGRLTALVNRLRHGEEPEPEMTAAELARAVRAMTIEAFGEAAVASPPEHAPPPVVSRPQSFAGHVLFFVGLVVGGALSAILAGTLMPVKGLSGELFSSVFRGPFAPLVLLGGGILVGFGTRMAGGCTSGHGLCGVSRLQPGSLLTTAAFFGTGIATSFAIGAFL